MQKLVCRGVDRDFCTMTDRWFCMEVMTPSFYEVVLALSASICCSVASNLLKKELVYYGGRLSMVVNPPMMMNQ